MPPRKFSRQDQAGTNAGRKLANLAQQLASGTLNLQLRSDPEALAPERLLVFDLTGDVYKFHEAVLRVPGLEFLGAEELDADEFDKSPALYLMVPSERALANIVTLWRDWQRDGTVPPGFGNWKVLLTQLRDIRPWGPRDRVMPSDWEVLPESLAQKEKMIRIEVELVFRTEAGAGEGNVKEIIEKSGGTVVSQCRIAGASYHAILADAPATAIEEIIEFNPNGLVGSDSVMFIRPQSVFQFVASDQIESAPIVAPPAIRGTAIASIFDAVPIAGHPLLAGRLSVDDPFQLEPLSVGKRSHGTAMASAVLHGDLHQPWGQALERQVHFVNMLYAPAGVGTAECCPDKLPGDLFHEAVINMFDGSNPTAPEVLIINVSLGDKNKPFANRLSGWARVIDFLSSEYGILFVVSAGNHGGYFQTNDVSASDFEALSPQEKAKGALVASKSEIGNRRLLSPAESINSITVGALNADGYSYPTQLPSDIFDIWKDTGLCSISSALGPGYKGATKPDILAPGGRHHVRLAPHGDHHRLHPLSSNVAHFAGIGVAAPPTSSSASAYYRSVGTSAAAALVTGVAARAHENLEAAYQDFLTLPREQRAVLLKALLVHGARWTNARDLLVEVLGPPGASHHYRQKDNVRRYIGYGAFDPEFMFACSEDRATLFAMGSLDSDQGNRFRIPWPIAMSGKTKPHGIFATLSWFSPTRPGTVSYRAVRMKIVEYKEDLGRAGVASSKTQPDPKQAHRGTVVHRRWLGEKAAAISGEGYFDLDVQRELDDIEHAVSFALVVTLEMPGENEIYTQIRNRVVVKPAVAVAI